MKKYALITGASRGIGRACAAAFAREGYHLYLTCLKNTDLLKEFREEILKKYGTECHIFTGDMGNPDFVKKLFSKINRLDVLINNAGISYIGLLQDMSDEQWGNVMSTNLNSCFYTSRAAIPLMLKQGEGHIINVSSIWGSAGGSLETAYSASKGGINAFTRALAKELAPSHIRVNAASFGVIDTDMNRCFSKEEICALCDDIPAGRMGTCEEAAQLLLLIARSPEYMTGQIITMDGGYL